MTKQEQKVYDALIEACNQFKALDTQHPNEPSDFTHGIHECQYVLMARLARRSDPDSFPCK